MYGYFFLHLLPTLYICWIFTDSTIFLYFLFYLKIKKLGIPSLVVYLIYSLVVLFLVDLYSSLYLPVASRVLLLVL